MCGEKLKVTRGIEIGNIFQLGDKYTRAYDVRVLDEAGKTFYPVMGCYGIGIGRLAGSVVEESHDDNGIIWPISISPFEVEIIALNQKNKDVLSEATKIYNQLKEDGFDILLDDREESAGVKFADADLIGIPIQIIVSEKLIKEKKFEIKLRSNNNRVLVDSKEITTQVATLVEREYLKYNDE